MLVHADHGSNSKVGRGVFVSTSSRQTCPDACRLKAGNGCYADYGPLGWHWNKVSGGQKGRPFEEFLAQVKALRPGELWRHNQAGDLIPDAKDSGKICTKALSALVRANRKRRGFTYTHYPLSTDVERRAVAEANANGFTVNLSADNPTEADAKAELGIGPVVTVLPMDVGDKKTLATPAGRKILVCPAVTKAWTCKRCELCYLADRKFIIGFPAHGTTKRKADLIASSTH